METLILIAALIALTLWFVWVVNYGLMRGTLAALLRLIWISPIVLAFKPKTQYENLPRSIALKPIHLLVDDSESMRRQDDLLNKVSSIESDLGEECLRLGCLIKKTRLSELSRETSDGYTPLSRILEPWLYSTAGEPWILLSDGGDYRPSLNWSVKLKNMGLDSLGKPRGHILGYKPKGHVNIWLESSDSPIFSFVDKPLDITVRVLRERDELAREVVQVQVLNEEKALATVNATFAPGEKEVDLRIPLSALSKGQHLLTIRALPGAEESTIWDNEVHKTVDVLPNTIGLLHLLGSPSWGGRFLRRSLKAEPKYDLISFFILRDPGDLQLVNERELSLIPFPVDRLFNEELPNFHVVILQNFALYQFLEPTYQKNLVEFVKNGGGLLFLGGSRALKPGDSNNSSLSSILPFSVIDNSGKVLPQLGLKAENENLTGLYYDRDLSFTLELADPSKDERDLADVFNDYKRLMPQLSGFKSFKGIHRMDNVQFKKGEYTPLLNANLKEGGKIPLAVASYPGKGRAIWLFTDSLYKIALEKGEEHSRALYQTFINSSLNWLLRQEAKRPLLIRDFEVDNSIEKGMKWSFNLVGAAGSYLDAQKGWKLKICGQDVNLEDADIEKLGFENWSLSGFIPMNVRGGSRCIVDLSGQHPAFGSLKSRGVAIVPELFRDIEIPHSPQKLMKLAELTGAEFNYMNQEKESTNAFLDRVTGRLGVSFPSRYRMIQDHYWVLDEPWFYLLLLGLPLEVIVRRWFQLTSMRRITGVKRKRAANEMVARNK